MNSDQLKSRTKALAIEIIRLTKKLPRLDESRIISNQIIRSVTSTAANYRAVLRARSNAEFFAKISIVVEEIDETLFWIEMIEEIGLLAKEEVKNTKQEATELLYVFSATRKSIKAKSKYN